MFPKYYFQQYLSSRCKWHAHRVHYSLQEKEVDGIFKDMELIFSLADHKHFQRGVGVKESHIGGHGAHSFAYTKL